MINKLFFVQVPESAILRNNAYLHSYFLRNNCAVLVKSCWGCKFLAFINQQSTHHTQTCRQIIYHQIEIPYPYLIGQILKTELSRRIVFEVNDPEGTEPSDNYLKEYDACCKTTFHIFKFYLCDIESQIF